MKKLLLLLPLLLLCALPAHAQLANARGWCEDGAQNVITSGLTSSTQVQASYPQCTVSVSIHGGGAATISSTGAGGALSNPFTATTNGQWLFYAANGEYDISLSGAGFPTTVTYSDVFINTGGGGGGGTGAGLATDNIFTNNNRFKGPIPYRDFTAYMPAGGCSSDYPTFGDPPATGTISSSSPTLTVSGAADFKTGCGVAVIGAGPTATVAMATTAIGTTTRSGTAVTFTVTSGDPHLVPGIGGGSDFAGWIKVTGCSDANFNTTGTGWILNFGSPVTSLVYNTAGSGGTTATGCTATFYTGWAHGTTGATTWNYKVAPIDSHGGVGAAIGPIAITNGNATLNYYNYNWVGWQFTSGARMFAVYRDDGAGGAYTCRDIAYSVGYADYGRPLPFGCPAYVPSTPPASPTAQTLNTTIASGGGTTTLTLAANASNTATNKNVYDDNSMFLASCINDAVADQTISNYISVGGGGCFIPYGRWPMNGDMPTDTISAASGVGIRVQGTLWFESWPWMIGSGYTIIGEGAEGNLSGLDFPYVLIERGTQMPAGLVIRGTSVNVTGIGLNNMMGDAIFITGDPAISNQTAGINLKNIVANVQDGLGIGVPLRINGNALFQTFENMNFIPRSDGFPASVLFTELQYAGNGHSDIHFKNIYTQWHHFVIDSPGGQNSGQGTGFDQTGLWWSEEHGQFPTGGLISLDTGVSGGTPGTPSSARLGGATLENMQNADASNKYLFSVTGSQPTSSGGIVLTNIDASFTQTLCLNGSTLCTSGYQIPIVSNGLGAHLPSSLQFFQGLVGTQYLMRRSVLFGNSGFSPSTPLWANEIPGAANLSVSSTGAGSLSAATYCFVLVGVDLQTTPGLTIPSPELCQAVGASSSINLFWQVNRFNELPNWRIYFGTSPGGETNYFTQAAANSTNQTYAFTTTAAATGGSPPSANNLGTAYSSWLQPPGSNNGPSCINCVPTNVWNHQLGIGDPAPPAGSEVSVKGGFLNLAGTTSGGSQIGSAAVGGAPAPLCFPTATAGGSGYFLISDAGTSPCQQLSWATAGTGAWANQTAGTNTNAGTFAATGNSWDFHGATHTLPIVSGAIGSIPATCTVGEIYFSTSATAGQNLYYCTGANVFTQQLNSGAAGASTALGNLAAVAINTTLLPAAVNTVALGSGTLPFTNLFVGTIANQSASFNTANLTANRAMNIPNATSTLVRDCPAVLHNFLTAIAIATGSCTQAQPAIADLSDGASVLSASSVNTLTNKTLNAESTGNTLSIPIKAFFSAGGCNNSTAGTSMDLGTTNAPTPQCSGTTVRKGTLAFARGNVAYLNWHLPPDWNSSAATDIELGFTTTDTTNGHVTSWNIQTACNIVNGTATDDPALNALQALSVTTGASQISGGMLTGTKTALTMTGCVADYNFEVAITRNNSGTDTNTDTAVGLKFSEITIGVSKNAANR